MQKRLDRSRRRSELWCVDSQIYRGKKHFLESVGLRTEKDLRVLWTARKTNEWVFNKAGVKRELLDTVKARKLTYYMVTT